MWEGRGAESVLASTAMGYKGHFLIFSSDTAAGHMVLDTIGVLIRSLQIVRFLHRQGLIRAMPCCHQHQVTCNFPCLHFFCTIPGSVHFRFCLHKRGGWKLNGKPSFCLSFGETLNETTKCFRMPELCLKVTYR